MQDRGSGSEARKEAEAGRSREMREGACGMGMDGERDGSRERGRQGGKKADGWKQ